MKGIEQVPYESGQLKGYMYIFYTAGPGLPLHDHPKEELHNIIVLQGKVKFISGRIRKTLNAGDVYDFDGSKPHQVDILESPAKLLNIFTHPCTT